MSLSSNDVLSWHRRLCPVTDDLVISGDLAEDPTLATHQLSEWRAAGITDVLDVRQEWSDAALVATHAPELRYWHLGTHDDGGSQSDEWFDKGLAAARQARENPDAVLLVHCHMGVNRGPSMAMRLLLDDGWDPIDALEAIRAARPIAAIAYAPDAHRHYLRSIGTDDEPAIERAIAPTRVWVRENAVDVPTIVAAIHRYARQGSAQNS